jgi:DNA-binding transcriptional ArsR family regulator
MTQTNRTCEPLMTALDSGVGGLSLTPELINLIVVRLEEAIADPRDAHLATLKDQLSSLFRSGMANIPATSIADLRQADKAASPIGAGYVLGNLAMAQALSARAMDRRCGDDFEQKLSSDGLKPYVRTLNEGPATNLTIAERMGHAPETVSRKLKILRELGAADFRRDGQHVYNFLTPAAVAVADGWAKVETIMPQPRKDHFISMLSEEREIPEYMKRAQNFSNVESPALEYTN